MFTRHMLPAVSTTRRLEGCGRKNARRAGCSLLPVFDRGRAICHPHLKLSGLRIKPPPPARHPHSRDHHTKGEERPARGSPLVSDLLWWSRLLHPVRQSTAFHSRLVTQHSRLLFDRVGPSPAPPARAVGRPDPRGSSARRRHTPARAPSASMGLGESDVRTPEWPMPRPYQETVFGIAPLPRSGQGAPGASPASEEPHVPRVTARRRSFRPPVRPLRVPSPSVPRTSSPPPARARRSACAAR